MEIKGYILYKIYYGDHLVYLGRTKQPLQNRLRGHLFKKPMHRVIDISQVSKVEYAMFKTEADMNLYEIYYINLYKPQLNIDDKTRDELTVKLPEVEFEVYNCPNWDKWKRQLNIVLNESVEKKARCDAIPLEYANLRKKKQNKELSEEEYYAQIEVLREEREQLMKELGFSK